MSINISFIYATFNPKFDIIHQNEWYLKFSKYFSTWYEFIQIARCWNFKLYIFRIHQELLIILGRGRHTTTLYMFKMLINAYEYPYISHINMAYASKLSACLYTSMKHYLITSFVRTDIILNAAITNDFFFHFALLRPPLCPHRKSVKFHQEKKNYTFRTSKS